MRVCTAFLSICLLLVPVRPQPGFTRAGPRIMVGPNMLVSRDGNVPHVETALAANPKDPRNLVGAAIVANRPEGGYSSKVYVSFDGGRIWRDQTFDDLMQKGGWDPHVVFTPQGTAIFMALWGDDNFSGFNVYRSRDGGRTWASPVDLGQGYDYEQVTVDTSRGESFGRIYVGVGYGEGRIFRIGVFRSDDDGRSFTGPVVVLNGAEGLGVRVDNLLTLSDGTLFVPYTGWPIGSAQPKRKDTEEEPFFCVTSKDGGRTFSAPRQIERRIIASGDLVTRNPDDPRYAVDGSATGFKDRLYVVWTDFRKGAPRILISRSSDGGSRWSEPRIVDPTVPAAARQFRPDIAVNSRGIVGVRWFDTRDSKGRTEYDEYFAASVDGGQSFLPAVRVSSESSNLEAPGNMIPFPMPEREDGLMVLELFSAAERFGAGGEYVSLAVDSLGAFHPFWIDGRNDAFQVYTASVEVLPDERPRVNPPAESLSRAPVQRSVLDLVELVCDPAGYDVAGREVRLPVRVKNVSHQTIYGPLRVEIVEFGTGPARRLKENAPTMLNASNGKTGVGAMFDYTPQLGSGGSLKPGEISGPLAWRFRLVDPYRTPYIRFSIVGAITP